LDLYKARRGSLYFLDYSFGSGYYSKNIAFDDSWGGWSAQTQAHQTSLHSRLGMYSSDHQNFRLGYIGLSGSYTKIDPISRISNALEINTSESSLASLSGKIGIENKTRVHIENIIVEPSICASFSLPLYEIDRAPTHTFYGLNNTAFQSDQFHTDKTTISINAALRIGIFKHTMIKLEVEGVKQSGDINGKAFFGVDVRL
jgi:DNA-binding XRE family transcriptional regulator